MRDNPTRARARAADERRKALGIPRSAIAEATPYSTAYLEQILRGRYTSLPVVEAVEDFLSTTEAQAGATS